MRRPLARLGRYVRDRLGTRRPEPEAAPANPPPEAEAPNPFPHYRRIHHHDGTNYRTVLESAHAFLRPKSYLEIGVNTGTTLASAGGIAIGVDPRFLLSGDVVGRKEKLFLFQQTSDAFFAATDPRRLAGGPVEMTFLDGLHECEALLRDFINTERVSGAGSVIFIHDCLPADIYMARRRQFDPEIRKLTPSPASWTGDVWKTLAVLRRHRPDLRITCLDASRTGLVAVTNLDPDSTRLRQAYDDLVTEMRAIETTHETLAAFLAECAIVSTARVASEAAMRETLGLPKA